MFVPARHPSSRDPNRKPGFAAKPNSAVRAGRVVDAVGNVWFDCPARVRVGRMFCEKAIELIRELQRMSDGQLPAFNVSPPRYTLHRDFKPSVKMRNMVLAHVTQNRTGVRSI